MTRIVVITDVHANLPALKAALYSIRGEGYDAIYHTGDVIGIGPYPGECLDLLLSTPRVHLVMGNHDAWFVNGLPEPQPSWMSNGEVQHQCWTHEHIDPELRRTIAQWPYVIECEFEGIQTTFVHYGLAQSGTDCARIVEPPNSRDLDILFEQHHSELIFYGHHHPFSDIQGRARYVNPGSLGCNAEAVARYTVVEFQNGSFSTEHRKAFYDDTELFETFEHYKVPDREFIYRAFFGGRYRK